MLNADTKRHIDAARDVLVGVAPNPMTQIDQITYALIYKFMDDMDQAAIKAGGEPSFFTGELEPYAWSKLVDSRMGNQEKMNLYGEALQKFAEAKQLPELFRTIFRAAFLPYRSPETLGLFLKEINYFDYSHPEELGNAYEYLLSIMSAQGDAGQFRTPRHIIDFMVDVMDPTKDDKVLDPACGTGGFLVASYNHILEKHDGKDDPKQTEKPLTPDERKKLVNNFEGYDIDPSMVRIAQVNMYLHQFKNPKIFQYDSLTSEDRWNDKFDVILANPPFMSPKGGIKPHNKFTIQSNRSEVLFVDYIANHLKPAGRAAIIVPEGVIFQSGKAYKELRKSLIERGLYSVVSLPSGVFQPYSGVKTSILLIDDVVAKTQDQILFIKVSNDGFELGAKKRVIESNDLPHALEALDRFRHGRVLESDISLLVKKSEIASDGDYNLSADRYKVDVIFGMSRWPVVSLGELEDQGHIEFLRGQNLAKSEIEPEGKNLCIHYGELYSIYGPVVKSIASKTNSSGRITSKAGDVLVPATQTADALGMAIASSIEVSDVIIGGDINVVRTENKKLLGCYLAYAITFGPLKKTLAGYAKGVNILHLSNKDLRLLSIPLPPLEFQADLVRNLEEISTIASAARTVIENWKPRFEISSDWPIVELGKLCSIGSSKRVFESEWKSSGVPFYRAREIVRLAKEGSVENELFISEEMYAEYSEKYGYPKVGDLMVTGVGTLGITYLVKKNDRFYFKDGNILWFSNFDERVRSEYLYYLFATDYIKRQIQATSEGGTVGTYTITNAKATKIPLPNLEEQDCIIARIQKEEKMIKDLMNFKKQTEEQSSKLISSVWGQ